MKNLFRQWNSINIIYRILGGLLLGIILALVFPDASAISLLGTIFVNALKGIAPLLVFFLVISSLCHAGQSHGGIIRTVIFLYLFSTLLAAVIAVIASFLFPVTLTLQNTAADMSAPQSITDVFNTLLLNIVANPVDSLANANYIGILAWAVLLGFGLRVAGEPTKKVFSDISSAISKVVTWIISFAPFGILGLVYSAITENGLSIFTEYGKLLALLIGCMLFIYFVTNPLLVFLCIRQNPFSLILKCLKDSADSEMSERQCYNRIFYPQLCCKYSGQYENLRRTGTGQKYLLRYHSSRSNH